MIDVFSASLPYIKEGTIPKSYTLFKEGDVAFADASEDTNDVAKAIEVINCDGQQIVSGLHTIHGRDILIRRLLAIKVMRLHPIHFTNRLEELHKEQRCFL